MSISDQIVVMKDGIFMQMGRPQEVYDDPASLFVAKFLGNPPINVFKGEVQKETLWLGPASPFCERRSGPASDRGDPSRGLHPH